MRIALMYSSFVISLFVAELSEAKSISVSVRLYSSSLKRNLSVEGLS